MLTREEIYELLKASKIEYERNIDYNTGMCKAIDTTCERLFPDVYGPYTYYYLYRLIPEFNPVYLDAIGNLDGYWWYPSDHEIRLKAFDKLIDLYR